MAKPLRNTADSPSRNLTWKMMMATVPVIIVLVLYAMTGSAEASLLSGAVSVPMVVWLRLAVYHRHWFW